MCRSSITNREGHLHIVYGVWLIVKFGNTKLILHVYMCMANFPRAGGGEGSVCVWGGGVVSNAGLGTPKILYSTLRTGGSCEHMHALVAPVFDNVSAILYLASAMALPVKKVLEDSSRCVSAHASVSNM